MKGALCVWWYWMVPLLLALHPLHSHLPAHPGGTSEKKPPPMPDRDAVGSRAPQPPAAGAGDVLQPEQL